MPEHIKQNKNIIQYDIWGNKIKTWCSAHEIERELGFDCSLIGKAIKKECLQAYGYQWIKNEGQSSNLFGKIPMKFGIIQKDKENNIVNKFASLSEAASYCNSIGSKRSIGNCCKGKQKFFLNYKWEYDYSIWDKRPYQRGVKSE